MFSIFITAITNNYCLKNKGKKKIKFKYIFFNIDKKSI